MSQGMKDRMFQRLASIVKQRFDTVITFTDFSARVRVADMRSVTAVQRNPLSPFIITGDDILIPIRSGDQLFGFLTLFRGATLSGEHIDQIRQISDLLLTESCLLEDRSHTLNLLEHYLQQAKSPEDVIDIKLHLEKSEVRSVSPEINVSQDHRDQVFPILIQCHQASDAKEFAIEIHRSTERSSFLTYESYLASEMTSVDSIKAMGPITLFIPNIQEVPLDIQSTIAAYLASPTRSTLHPRVICAVQESADDLIMTGQFESLLFEQVSSARLKLPPKGTSNMALEEILEFFNPHLRDQAPRPRHLQIVRTPDPSDLM